MNSELCQFSDWTIANRMIINPDKSKFMIITHQIFGSTPDVILNSTRIERVSVTRFLGIKINAFLTFKSHTDLAANKISRNIAVLYRISAYMPLTVLRQLYFPFIQSHLCFGMCTWGSCAPSNLNRLVQLQSRAARLFGVHETF